MIRSFCLALLLLACAENVFAFKHTPVIVANQVAYNTEASKTAIVQWTEKLPKNLQFAVLDSTGRKVYTSAIQSPQGELRWEPSWIYYTADFSEVEQPGKYRLAIKYKRDSIYSAYFVIGEHALASLTLPSIIQYYFKQRASTPQEQEADRHVLLYGSNETVDIRGGWCDASGDISKYFSHLAYTNFMLPQQTPLVTWSMINALENMRNRLEETNSTAALESEALWGADYIMRSLSPKGYFYMTVFSYFKPDPNERRIVGLLANSVTTSDYQCAFREGGGMAIAALARISQWKKAGEFSSTAYLDAAVKAFAHLQKNNLRYADDGKENILDDYCALMASTELWIATDENIYREEARKRAASLCKRLSPGGYFIADDTGRPFWHASDAGLPVISLARFLQKEKDAAIREQVITTIAHYLDYQLNVTNKVTNPFGYARQTFRFRKEIKDGFFIPHENESGWWWQGENARLASLASAALIGGRIAFANDKTKQQALNKFAWQQLSWILGCNPYNTCFMYGFGKLNVPYMHSMFGHGSEKGGISNGVTGSEAAPDGSWIEFKREAGGNEWRWTEQWIPHSAWFLQALTALEN